MFINTKLGLFDQSGNRTLDELGADWQECSVEEFNTRIAAGEPFESRSAHHDDWWWVTKDAIVSRIATYGDDAVLALDTIIQAQSRVQQIKWREYAVFRSDNQELRALAGALAQFGVDLDFVFSRDPLAPERK